MFSSTKHIHFQLSIYMCYGQAKKKKETSISFEWIVQPDKNYKFMKDGKF